jgi:heterodisulfide reductase subunit C
VKQAARGQFRLNTTNAKTQPVPAPSGRGPLRAIILASTGQDIARCTHCDLCDKYLQPEMDLTIAELMQAASRNENRALKSKTLWVSESLLDHALRCQSGLELTSILMVMQREAIERGINSPQALT